MSQPIEAGRQHLYEKTAHATGSIIMNIAVAGEPQVTLVPTEELAEEWFRTFT
jgi:hypothetical protein